MSVLNKTRSFGLVIVGDEILSGRRQDQHLSKVIDILKQRGIQLSWAEFIADEPDKLVKLYKRTFEEGGIVFSCGGIGATPDDHTRQSAAHALGLPLCLHPEAQTLITERSQMLAEQGKGSADMQAPENQTRLKMGEFPQGACIIPNPYNQIPGFSINDHHFLPGFPVMAWPMIEWVLDTYYKGYFNSFTDIEKSIYVYDIPESLLVPIMQKVESLYAPVKTFCLPTVATAEHRARIELGVKGQADSVQRAFEVLLAEVSVLGGECEFISADAN